ncbi:StfH/YfcO family fimbrial adhesin, partial [Pseudomonas aeruginosa]|uniref:StfH/YfcO family fimbrial adhesin n=1 Tax=Pseudomonas aeruginosa TaxID=287 RepID=UPI003D33D99D
MGNIPNTVWTGPGSAPTMNITHQSNTVDNSNCPGITDGWSCVDLGVDIIVHGETHGCPWLVSTNTV